MGEEKRKFVRHSVNIPSSINTKEVNGYVKDISEGGVSIQTAVELKEAANLYFIFLVGSKNINCEGKVRVKIKKEDGYKYGIAFYQQFHAACLKLVDSREGIKSVEIES